MSEANESQNKLGPEEKKEVTIYVNTDPFQVPKEDITYDKVVTLGFPDFPQHPERNYSVKYKRGHGDKPEGVLAPGGTVKVKDQMSLDVWFTGES